VHALFQILGTVNIYKIISHYYFISNNEYILLQQYTTPVQKVGSLEGINMSALMAPFV